MERLKNAALKLPTWAYLWCMGCICIVFSGNRGFEIELFFIINRLFKLCYRKAKHICCVRQAKLFFFECKTISSSILSWPWGTTTNWLIMSLWVLCKLVQIFLWLEVRALGRIITDCSRTLIIGVDLEVVVSRPLAELLSETRMIVQQFSVTFRCSHKDLSFSSMNDDRDDDRLALGLRRGIVYGSI